MIIHLIGSLRHFNEDLIFMQTIAAAIQQHKDNAIALNWFEAVESRSKRQTRAESSFNWEEIVTENINAVKEADALIVEGSRFNYSQGYQTALALQANKPVLNLYRKDPKEYREWPDKLFVSGIAHPLFQSVAYKDEKDLKKIIAKFIQDHTPKTHNVDVKLALESSVYKKLDRLSKETGKSPSSLIKDIVSRNF